MCCEQVSIWREQEKSFPKPAKVATGQNWCSQTFLKAPEPIFVGMYL